MKNLTTPQSILCGFGLVALAIIITSYAPNSVIKEAKADYLTNQYLDKIVGQLSISNNLFSKSLWEINETLKKCN